MEIPKMKILIYVLTFLGYAWSGYGAGIVTNLRDAILAAEHVFGDILENVVSLMKHWKNLTELVRPVDEKCIFTCSNGAKPVRNKYHRPSSNGCGAYGLQISVEHLPVAEMTRCCDEHDLCYDTCAQDKEQCDLQFRRCLHKICDTHTNTRGEDFVKGCKTAADVLYTGTLTMGCKSYIDSQNQACYCGYTKTKPFTGGDRGDL